MQLIKGDNTISIIFFYVIIFLGDKMKRLLFTHIADIDGMGGAILSKLAFDNIDIIDTVHPVINYNGNYYDYTAQRYNNSFDDLISTTNIPITQSIIHSDNQINSNLSTVKGTESGFLASTSQNGA